MAQGKVPAEVGPGRSGMATIVVALGMGFAASAGLAYMNTAKCGLIPSPKPVVHE